MESVGNADPTVRVTLVGRRLAVFDTCNSDTCNNAERQKVLPPPASDCHAVRTWRSSPSGTRHNRRILRENMGVGEKATQKTAHSAGLGRPHEVAGSRTGAAPIPCPGDPIPASRTSRAFELRELIARVQAQGDLQSPIELFPVVEWTMSHDAALVGWTPSAWDWLPVAVARRHRGSGRSPRRNAINAYIAANVCSLRLRRVSSLLVLKRFAPSARALRVT